MAALPSTDQIEAIGSAVAVHGSFSDETFAAVRASQTGRLATLDADVLVVWPTDQAACHHPTAERRGQAEHLDIPPGTRVVNCFGSNTAVGTADAATSTSENSTMETTPVRSLSPTDLQNGYAWAAAPERSPNPAHRRIHGDSRPVTTPQLKAEDFTEAEADKLHRLVTGLLRDCRDLTTEHAPDGTWRAPDGDLIDEFEHAKKVIETLSRSLNGTRSGLRRIDTNARQRLINRQARAMTGQSALPPEG